MRASKDGVYDRGVGANRPLSRDDLIDWSLAVAVAAAAVLQQLDCSCRVDPVGANIVILLVATLPIGLRRRWPVGVFLVTASAALLHVLLGFTNQFPVTFAVVIATFSMASYAPWPLAVLGGAAIALGLPVNFVVDWSNHGHVSLEDIPYNYGLFGGAWVLGDNLRRERERVRRAERARADEEQRALDAVVEERARIARDLHDAVAHSLSVITLQAGAGRRVAIDRPERGRAALAAIEQLGRESVADMRRLVGLLRSQNGAEMEPQPSLARLEGLVERVRATGLEVAVLTEGTPSVLPPGVDLSAYRIIQEALTNTLRHASASRAEVVVRYGSTGVEVEVTDDGRGPAANGHGHEVAAGHGLLGMRERVGMFGGELESGARAGGGFRVRAVLPVDLAAGQ
jgi:signal transduction histidine kinase